MKEYTTHFDNIFDMNSTDKYHNMTDRMMKRLLEKAIIHVGMKVL